MRVGARRVSACVCARCELEWWAMYGLARGGKSCVRQISCARSEVYEGHCSLMTSLELGYMYLGALARRVRARRRGESRRSTSSVRINVNRGPTIQSTRLAPRPNSSIDMLQSVRSLENAWRMRGENREAAVRRQRDPKSSLRSLKAACLPSSTRRACM